ncbi:hypothetical protein E2566_04520 [Pectobacterium punjabense]|uniref:Type 1 fimbrial protein n=1 Tax=Pectobacterium punjabense TaxID=2108399 RepID=A0ABX6KYY1_9GAMM|nr:hypothetical protein [Pectobacterium punjabense]MBS4431028.1 hypothetical protein [Pectobacterium punjabense]MBT9183059.1 hypothetical protein [Pectobacterium punjabense]PTA65591.1 hypothetical protein C9I36_04150 [Pectobacterium punjabense]QJA19248.1 hypothetical protein E2566_04520 [Pectobacterium punjabense]
MHWLAIRKNRYVVFCAALCLSLTAFNASALECRLGTVTGPVADYEDIGTLKIPATLPIGSRLWTSKSYTRSLACWAYYSVRPQGEMSYFYPNPEGKIIGQGIGIGIIYNGQDLGVITNGGSTSSRVPTGQWVIAGPSGSSPPASPTMLNVTVQLYLEKTGNITDTTAGADSLRVFQIDGEGGINNKPDSNYGLSLSGLHGIDIMQCAATINVSPDSYVDFGTVRAWSGTEAGPLAQSEFNIDVSTDGGEDCGKGFDLDINFDATSRGNSLVGIDGMNMGNGATLKIEDMRSGNNVTFNQFISLVEGLTAASGVVERRYKAQLYAAGPATVGDTEKNIILRFNYH